MQIKYLYVDAWHIFMWLSKYIAKLLQENNELLFGLFSDVGTNFGNFYWVLLFNRNSK